MDVGAEKYDCLFIRGYLSGYVQIINGKVLIPTNKMINGNLVEIGIGGALPSFENEFGKVFDFEDITSFTVKASEREIFHGCQISKREWVLTSLLRVDKP
jgi:hypothetical protein